ncbi:carboxymethylenebutenolidase [Actinomycetes bacterium]|nr:carboxymethylenebutenolidase [Actinomycetes bacterium]
MRNIKVEIKGEQVDGVIALPASGSGLGVLVIQEWWGLVPHIQGLVQRLAAAGFVALAVDHYRGVETTEPDEAQKLMMGLQVSGAAADLAGAATYLVGRPEVTSTKIAVLGFCMGGGLALLAPTVSDDIACAAAFYPAMPWPDYAPDWANYAGKAALVHKAESDEDWAGPKITEYATAITAHGGKVQVFDYPGSEHAFFNDDRPEVYAPQQAEAAWERSTAFFRAQCT